MLKNGAYILLLFFILSCTNDSYSDLIQNNSSLNLKFNTYETATINDGKIGLEWALSQIGATKTQSVFGGIIENERVFTIDYNQLGFTNNALIQLEKLHQKIKESQEYKITNAIDLGRYVALIIGASEHYFKIVEVPENLTDILNQYTLKPTKGYVNNSLVSLKHRIVEYSEQNDLNQLLLTSEVDGNTGEILEYETIELMENGHLKFGVFDENGLRKSNASPTISNAGKPAKCMWCHESTISRLFSVQNNFTGYLSYIELKNELDNFTDLHIEKKLNLTNGVDFSQNQHHEKMELVYISFMEPSAKVLSKEWSLPLSEVQNRLASIQTHLHEEFDFLGDLYYRNEIAQFAPFTSLEVSSSIREASQLEVNYIN